MKALLLSAACTFATLMGHTQPNDTSIIPIIHYTAPDHHVMDIQHVKKCKKLSDIFILRSGDEVISFQIVFAPPSGNSFDIVCYGDQFTSDVLELIASAKPKYIIIFRNIMIRNNGKTNEYLNNTIVTVKLRDGQ